MLLLVLFVVLVVGLLPKKVGWGCVILLYYIRRVTILGRNANNGTNASTFFWNLNNASSNANRNIGSQLAGCCN